MAIARVPVVIGDCRFSSGFMSNRWFLTRGDDMLAEMRRIPSRHVSEVLLADGTIYEIRPEAWGTVVAISDEAELGRIVRTSWWGRSWDLTGPGFACALTSDPLPRRWSLRIGTEPVGRLKGSPLSYNRLAVHTDVAVPVSGLTLAWHILVRPWEAAAAPVALVPGERRPDAYRVVPNA
jgi:hypothetical protein